VSSLAPVPVKNKIGYVPKYCIVGRRQILGHRRRTTRRRQIIIISRADASVHGSRTFSNFADGTIPTTLPSPGSSIRDGAQRILQLCQKSEWSPLDQALKVVEKLVATGGDDVTSTPLAGVVDQVGSLGIRVVYI